MENKIKKIIGIIGRPDKNLSNKDVFIIIKEFKDIVLNFNCIPIGIIPNINNINNKMNDSEIKNLNTILNICDGFILQGGDEYYDYDRVILKYAIENDIPILGVCLGAQLMASLTEDNLTNIDLTKYKNHNIDKKYAHDIIIDKNSKLYKILGKNKIKVNSYHNERIIDSGIYKISAYSEDGIIEAIEYNKNKFNIGVQFHPEKNINDKNMYKIFESFFNNINN